MKFTLERYWLRFRIWLYCNVVKPDWFFVSNMPPHDCMKMAEMTCTVTKNQLAGEREIELTLLAGRDENDSVAELAALVASALFEGETADAARFNYCRIINRHYEQEVFKEDRAMSPDERWEKCRWVNRLLAQVQAGDIPEWLKSPLLYR